MLTAELREWPARAILRGAGAHRDDEVEVLVEEFLDWPLEDPKGKPIERVREIRDEIRERVRDLVTAEGWA